MSLLTDSADKLIVWINCLTWPMLTTWAADDADNPFKRNKCQQTSYNETHSTKQLLLLLLLLLQKQRLYYICGPQFHQIMSPYTTEL